jgi:ketosteroid isomerase-like protein
MMLRTTMLTGFACAALATLALAQTTNRAADEAAIKAVIQAFIDTREANDVAGLTELLTADVDQLQTSGNMRSGRNEVVSGSLQTTQTTGSARAKRQTIGTMGQVRP